MKKIIAIAIALMTVFSLSTVALAENTTVLTTTVPDAEYKLNIPADQKIDFGATETEIGDVTVSGSSGFSTGKNLKVTLTYDEFRSEGVTTTIPFSVSGKYYEEGYGTNPGSWDTETFASGSSLTFCGNSDGTAGKYATYTYGAIDREYTKYVVNIDSAKWGKALGGDYTATITFTAEVVAE